MSEGFVERALPCPICQESMHVEKIRMTEVDVCDTHGIWLDTGELEQIVERVRKSRDKTHRHQLQHEKHRSRTAGWLMGPLAHWFD